MRHRGLGRLVATVTFAASLAGCGGGGASSPRYTINVDLEGLLGSSVTIANNGSDMLTLSADGRYSFATPASGGAAYNVIVENQPATPPQFCRVTGATGTVGSSSPTVTVKCASTVLTSRLIDLATGALGAVVSDTSRNRLYVTALQRNEVIVIDSASYLVLDHFFAGSGPLAAALSSDTSTLYVGLNAGGAVVLVNPDTGQLSTIQIGSVTGTPEVDSLVEVSPGLLLVGSAGPGTGAIKSGVGNLVALDVRTRDVHPVAAGLVVGKVSFLARSPDGSRVFGLGIPFDRPGNEQVLFSLDATKLDFPLLRTVVVDSVLSLSSIAVNRDGTRILGDTGAVYDAATLQVITGGQQTAFGAVGQSADFGDIALSRQPNTLIVADGTSLATLVRYTNDCPSLGAVSITPSPTHGDWVIGLNSNVLCVVSTTSPSSAPGAAGSRALTPFAPEPQFAPWVEVPEPAGGIVIDSPRGLAYVSNATGSVDLFSLADIIVVGSIAVPGKPGVVRLSSDGSTLYVGLVDLGKIITIDLNTRAITNTVDIRAEMGTPNIFRIAEISPGHVLAASIPDQGGIGAPTYLVDVVLNQMGSAKRVGCSGGYMAAQPVVSADKHYLYVMGGVGCAPGEKRDLTKPGYPVVASSLPVGYYGDGGLPVLTADGAKLIYGGVVIDTTTMLQTARLGGGRPLASSDPDRFYFVGGPAIVTAELHDLKILSIAQNACQTVYSGVIDSSISADEKIVISAGPDFFGGVCATRIAP